MNRVWRNLWPGMHERFHRISLEIEIQLLIATDDQEIMYRTERDNTIQSEHLQDIKQLGVTPVEINPHIRKGTMCNHLILGNKSFKDAGLHKVHPEKEEDIKSKTMKLMRSPYACRHIIYEITKSPSTTRVFTPK